MRAGPAVIFCILIVLSGCSTGLISDSMPTATESPTLNSTPMATESPTPNPADVDRDGDDLSLALENELGTLDNSSNDRMSSIYIHLGKNQSESAKDFLRYVAENPHNVWPQIKEHAVYKDGQVTAAELKQMSDKDEDGLIYLNEKEIGTDPNETDTDMDGLPDGWEWGDGVVINGKYIPLNNSDPLHKDIFLRIIPIDGNLSSQLGPAAPENETALAGEEAEQKLIARYANSSVTNPDGETGIDLHVSYEEENLEKYTREEQIGAEDTVVTVAHDYWGAYYFAKLVDIAKEGTLGWGNSPGYTHVVEPQRDDLSDDFSGEYKPHIVLDHELIHNIVGGGSEQIKQAEALVITDDVVAAEVSEYGIKGLPRVSDPIYVKGNWSDYPWEMPDNRTRAS